MSQHAVGPDPFEMDDAAYLLGALSPHERARYEQHLQSCDACSRSVTELAGLPGVLRRVPVEVVLGMDDAHPAGPDDVPPSVLTGVLARAEAEDRRRRRVTALRWASALTTAAAALVVATLAFLGPDPAVPDRAATVQPPTAELDLQPLVETRLSANVSLRDVAWGTKIQLECAYPDTGAGGAWADAPPQYSLVVRDSSGTTEQVATWNAVPGRELTIDAATAVRGDDIAAIEIRAADGTPVLSTAAGTT